MVLYGGFLRFPEGRTTKACVKTVAHYKARLANATLKRVDETIEALNDFDVSYNYGFIDEPRFLESRVRKMRDNRLSALHSVRGRLLREAEKAKKAKKAKQAKKARQKAKQTKKAKKA